MVAFTYGLLIHYFVKGHLQTKQTLFKLTDVEINFA